MSCPMLATLSLSYLPYGPRSLWRLALSKEKHDMGPPLDGIWSWTGCSQRSQPCLGCWTSRLSYTSSAEGSTQTGVTHDIFSLSKLETPFPSLEAVQAFNIQLLLSNSLIHGCYGLVYILYTKRAAVKAQEKENECPVIAVAASADSAVLGDVRTTDSLDVVQS